MKISFNPSMPPLSMKKMDSDSDDGENQGPGNYNPDTNRFEYNIKDIDCAI